MKVEGMLRHASLVSIIQMIPSSVRSNGATAAEIDSGPDASELVEVE